MGRTTLVEVEVDYTVIYSRKLTFATYCTYSIIYCLLSWKLKLLMRVLRAKSVRKHLKFYNLIFGITGSPYHVSEYVFLLSSAVY